MQAGSLRYSLCQRMELYQLRSFVTVAREGSIARAAERLSSSAPAVSAHIKALEDELSVRLFERSPAGMTLTRAGEDLWDEAETVLNASRRLVQRADELRGRLQGCLRLGLNNEFETIRAPELLADLAKTHPELSFATVYGSSGNITQGLIGRDLDVGYFEGPHDTTLLTGHPIEERQVVIVYPRVWNTSLDDLDLAALLRHPWVFVRPECSHYGLFHKVLAEAGLTHEPRFRVNEDLNALNLVAEGLGLSLAAENQLVLHPRRDELRVWPHFRRSLTLHFGYRIDRSDDPLVTQALEAVSRVWNLPSSTPVR